jgi:quercetin dioxygenase-like cupin family protein
LRDTFEQIMSWGESLMAGSGATVPRVVQPGAGEKVAIPGFGAVFKIYSRDTDGEVAVVEHPFAVGMITAPHRHTREDEHSMVLEGKIGFRSDDTEVVLEPGGFITKPRGQMHAMWNATDVPGRILEIITPGGFENYFRELGELLAPQLDESGVFAKKPASSLHESEPFAELAAKYGLTYGTPDWLPVIIKTFNLTPPTH